MSMSDPLADMLTRIRNAGMVKFESIDMPHSRLKAGVAQILKEEGYISDFHVIEDNKQGILRIDLKYDQGRRQVITGLRKISKPGRRMYVKADEIPRVMSGMGISVLSTSRGVMGDIQARRQGVGGELLCEVW
jgi:small subunit ribosomal protein S8